MQNSSPIKSIKQIYPGQVIANRVIAPPPHLITANQSSLNQQSQHIPKQQGVQHTSNFHIHPVSVPQIKVVSEKIPENPIPKVNHQQLAFKESKSLSENPPVTLKEANYSAVESQRIPLGLGLPQLPGLVLEGQQKAEPQPKIVVAEDNSCTFCRVIPWILAFLLLLALTALILFMIFFRHIHIESEIIPLCGLSNPGCVPNKISLSSTNQVPSFSNNIQPTFNTGGVQTNTVTEKVSNTSGITKPQNISVTSNFSGTNSNIPTIDLNNTKLENTTTSLNLSSSQNVTLTPRNITFPSQNITFRPQNVTLPPQNVTLTPQNLSLPLNTTAPQNISSVTQNVSFVQNFTASQNSTFSETVAVQNSTSSSSSTTVQGSTTQISSGTLDTSLKPSPKPIVIPLSVSPEELFNLQDHSNYQYIHLRRDHKK